MHASFFVFLRHAGFQNNLYEVGFCFSFVWFELGWVFPRLISILLGNIEAYIQIFNLKMLFCREFSKPKFHRIVQIRCIVQIGV